MKKKVLFAFGTRPEAIKMAPIIMKMKNDDVLHPLICVTAQHRQMLDQVLTQFGIVPDIDLNLMQINQSLSDLTARILCSMDQVLAEQQPDLVLIQGDTTSILATALACFYKMIPVGHVEAGLRSGDIHSPFPEEMNRRAASLMSHFHFAPTERARQALLNEGVATNNIIVTGNTVIDALQYIISTVRPDHVTQLLGMSGILPDGTGRKLILVTAHRRENFGHNIESICRGMKALVERNHDVAVIFPVHMNPNVRNVVYRLLQGCDRVILTEPVGYATMAHLLKVSYLVLTDSGGIQEEAPSLGKPVLVMRRETERPEGLEAGTAKLVGTDTSRIIAETETLLSDPVEYSKMSQAVNPYGDGHAADRIMNFIRKELQ